MPIVEAAVERSDAADERPPAHIFQRPPGWFFHAALVPAVLWLLYAFTFPGFDFFGAALALALLGLAALVWILRVATLLWARRKGSAAGSLRWLAVAPLGGLLVAAILLFPPWVRGRIELRRKTKTLQEAEVDLERLRQSIDKISGRTPAPAPLEPSQDLADE